MPLIYLLAERNAGGTERLYRERYPQIDGPDRWMYSNLNHNLCEYGSLRGHRHNEEVPRVTRTPSMEHNILDIVQRNQSNSVRVVAAAAGGSRSSVRRCFAM
ncbi:hypothetical protein TNCV_676701 [Trichonephila clavipes]|nr:hypothetical protein TNCV_676701 [Trichonephila clavipes]